jgi:hypothetical protein
MSDMKKSYYQNLIWPFLIIVVFTIVRMVQAGGHSVTAQVDDTLLGIAVDNYNPVFIPLSSVIDVQLIDQLGSWELVDGDVDDKFVYGTCQSQNLGTVQISAYTDASSYIVLKTDDETLIYNLATKSDTKKSYKNLKDTLEKSDIENNYLKLESGD